MTVRTENSIVPIEEAQAIAKEGLQDVRPELITPELCQWAISQAMRGMVAISIRQQALEAQCKVLAENAAIQDQRIRALELENSRNSTAIQYQLLMIQQGSGNNADPTKYALFLLPFLLFFVPLTLSALAFVWSPRHEAAPVTNIIQTERHDQQRK